MKISLAALVAAISLLSVTVHAAGLAATWNLEGSPFLTLRENGSGRMLMEEEDIHWKEANGFLQLTDAQGQMEQVPFTLSGEILTLQMPGMPLQLSRAGGAPADAAAPAEKAAVPDPTAAKPQAVAPPAAITPAAPADELSKLLLSSSWCSFSYNKVSGSTHTSRVTFGSDGSWGKGARGEGYSSGYGGTMASQHDSQSGGRWEVRNGTLYMSTAPNVSVLAPVNLKIEKNSNGYPILTADGKEYSSCQ